MSYILDALKRADAERARGAAPGLHTRHEVPAGSPGTARTTRKMGLVLAAGLALAILALFVWVARAPETPTPPPLAPAAVTAPAPAAPVIAAAPPAAITPMAPAPRPAVLAEAAQVPALPPPAAKALAAPSSSPGKPEKPAIPVPAATPVNQAAASTPAPAAVPLMGELPPDVRSQIPKITITGSVYSDSPAQRLLLINNLVLSQGSQVAADLTLEEIQPRSSVFSFKGSRFRVMH